MSYGESAGEPTSPDLANDLALLHMVFWTTSELGWGHVYSNALRKWRSQMVDLGDQNLVIDHFVQHMVSCDKCPVAVANALPHSNDVSPARPTSTAKAK